MFQEGLASASREQELGMAWDMGMLEGEFPIPGMCYPCLVEEKSAGSDFSGTVILLGCHWTITRISFPIPEGQQRDHQNLPGMKSWPWELLPSQFPTFPLEISLTSSLSST